LVVAADASLVVTVDALPLKGGMVGVEGVLGYDGYAVGTPDTDELGKETEVCNGAIVIDKSGKEIDWVANENFD
jgi:hypothetical protein